MKTKIPETSPENGSRLATRSRHRDYVIDGPFVTTRSREAGPDGAAPGGATAAASSEPTAPEILTIEQIARQAPEGIDVAKMLSAMGDLGPEARLLVVRHGGKAVRWEVFEDPRICIEIQRGAVIENLNEKPADVSGWRTHEFFIDVKGCLGDECGRCATMCPENAIHLMGRGPGSFHEIDPLACKGCFICWVECVRTAADCILVDGKTFDPGMRAKHFGE
jgi:Pyruvate/2-oxoacid:ferredoxin oxidoreductase delta subunit